MAGDSDGSGRTEDAEETSDDSDDPEAGIGRLFEGLIVVAIVLHLYWQFVQPALVRLSPIFARRPDVWTGRYPDTPAQLVLVAIALVGVGVDFLLTFLLRSLIKGETGETLIDSRYRNQYAVVTLIGLAVVLVILYDPLDWLS